jgi:hypothetical protein
MNHENKKKLFQSKSFSINANLNTTPENSLNTLIRKTKTKREREKIQ